MQSYDEENETKKYQRALGVLFIKLDKSIVVFKMSFDVNIYTIFFFHSPYICGRCGRQYGAKLSISMT